MPTVIVGEPLTLLLPQLTSINLPYHSFLTIQITAVVFTMNWFYLNISKLDTLRLSVRPDKALRTVELLSCQMHVCLFGICFKSLNVGVINALYMLVILVYRHCSLEREL